MIKLLLITIVIICFTRCTHKSNCEYVLPLDFHISKLSDSLCFLNQGSYIDCTKMDSAYRAYFIKDIRAVDIFKDSCEAKTYFIKHWLPMIQEFIK